MAETLTQTAAGPVRRLTCTCCGARTYGRQWWNQDAGYGLCRGCAPRCLEAENRDKAPGDPSFYGLRGVHYDCPEEPAILAKEDAEWAAFIASLPANGPSLGGAR